MEHFISQRASQFGVVLLTCLSTWGLAHAQSSATGAPKGVAAPPPASAPSYITQKDISGFPQPTNQLGTNPDTANNASRGAPGTGSGMPPMPASAASRAASAS